MKNRLMLLTALILTLCALLVCGSALADNVNLVIPESDQGSFTVQQNGTVITTSVNQVISQKTYWYYTVAEGDTVTLTSTPVSGYRLDSITVSAIRSTTNGLMPGTEYPVTPSGASSYTFTVPTGKTYVKQNGLLVEASYSEAGPVFYAVTAAVPDDGGTGNTVTVDKASAEAGETVTVTLGMNPGTKLATGGLTAHKAGDNSTTVALTQVDDKHYTFVMPGWDVRVTGVFEFIQYAVTVEQPAGFTLAADRETAHVGETVTVTVSPASAVVLAYYTADGQRVDVDVSAVVNNRATFTMPAAPVTVTAEIPVVGQPISLSAVDEATGSEITGNNRASLSVTVDGTALNAGSFFAEAGQTVEVTVTGGSAVDEYFLGISGLSYTYEENGETVTGQWISRAFDTATKNASGSFVMPDAPVTLTAVQRKGWYVTLPQASELGSGTLTLSPDIKVAWGGEVFTVQAQLESVTTGNAPLSVTRSDGVKVMPHLIPDEPFGWSFVMPECSVNLELNAEKSAAKLFALPPNLVSVVSLNHGFASVFAGEGDTVRVTLQNGARYHAIIAKADSGEEIFAEEGSDGVFTFAAPAENATVYASILVKNPTGADIDLYDYQVFTKDMTTLTSGWYVVDTDMTLNTRLLVTGNVNLVLDQNAQLTANQGVHLPEGHYLTIWKTINGGSLIAYSEGGNAAIGGDNKDKCGHITINGANILASSSGGGAGIGDGATPFGEGDPITINGGSVTAFATGGGAGIGGGSGGSNPLIYINGGAVTVFAGGDGAAIGGGASGALYKEIVINGGKVSATVLGGDGAGIGSGAAINGIRYSKGVVEINGGIVSVTQTEAKNQGSYSLSRATAVGHSGAGFSSYTGGRLRDGVWIADDMRITAQTHANRTSHIEKSVTEVTGYAYDILVEPCPHEHTHYSITPTTHKPVCDDCRIKNPEEAHTPDANGVCTVCGYDSHSLLVTFDADGGTETEAQMVATGAAATEPEAPEKEGYTFEGWYRVLDAEAGTLAETAYDFTAPVTGSLTLKAVWRELGTFIVTFDANGGTAVEPQTVHVGECVDLPDAPTREGHTFEGWFHVRDGVMTDEGFGCLEPITEDITLRARWGEGYTFTLLPGEGTGEAVTLRSDDAANWAETITAGKYFTNNDGTHFACPDVPEGFTAPEGLSFRGWLVDDGTVLHTEFMPVVGLNKPTYTLTAQWARIYTITWAAQADTAWASGLIDEAAAGERVTAMVYLNQSTYDAGSRLLALKLTGADFAAVWVTADITGRSLPQVTPIAAGNGTVVYPVPFTMPAGDTTVTAVIGRPFGTADFTLPAGVTAIEESAFEGAAMTRVIIPEDCESIGDYAFRDCAGLTCIRIPADCTLGTDVFAGCGTVYVFAPADSAAEAYCRSHGNCVFVAE